MKASDEPKGHEGEGSQEPAKEPLSAFEQRAPLLRALDKFIHNVGVDKANDGDWFSGGHIEVTLTEEERDAVAKITSGELRVVETVKMEKAEVLRPFAREVVRGIAIKCSGCRIEVVQPRASFCPGCGAQIVQ